jgi:hypothetical protein
MPRLRASGDDHDLPRVRFCSAETPVGHDARHPRTVLTSRTVECARMRAVLPARRASHGQRAGVDPSSRSSSHASGAGASVTSTFQGGAVETLGGCPRPPDRRRAT